MVTWAMDINKDPGHSRTIDLDMAHGPCVSPALDITMASSDRSVCPPPTPSNMLPDISMACVVAQTINLQMDFCGNMGHVGHQHRP